MSHYECKKCHKRYDDCTCVTTNDEHLKVGDYVVRRSSHMDPSWTAFCKFMGKAPVVSEPNTSGDMVTKPKHYEFFEGVEAITIIARSMTEKQFAGYCMGNALKYRLRAGKKFNTEEDLKKADYYKELFQKHRHECIDEDI